MIFRKGMLRKICFLKIESDNRDGGSRDQMKINSKYFVNLDMCTNMNI